MSWRNPTWWLGLFGALAVLGVLLVGLDARRAAASGPLWKRRLLTAGLALLGWMGLTGCDGKADPDPGDTTCYFAGPVEPVFNEPRDILKRMEDRLPLLESFAASDQLDKAAIRKTLQAIDQDLKGLSDPDVRKAMTSEETERARELIRKTTDLQKEIQDSVQEGAGTMNTSDEWKTLEQAWAFCRPFAESGESTEAERQVISRRLNRSKEAIQALLEEERISESAAKLLLLEEKTIRERVYRNPPKPTLNPDGSMTAVMCYDMMVMAEARISHENLLNRLPLLHSLSEKGTLPPAVIEKVLATVEKDLAVLSSEEKLAELTPQEIELAKETRDQVAAFLEKLKESR